MTQEEGSSTVGVSHHGPVLDSDVHCEKASSQLELYKTSAGSKLWRLRFSAREAEDIVVYSRA